MFITNIRETSVNLGKKKIKAERQKGVVRPEAYEQVDCAYTYIHK